MPRPPRNAIHEAEYQIKDFFNDESMKRLYPKNPYNVLWFMEECLSTEQLKEPGWIKFKNHILECLKDNNNIDYRCNPFKDKMIEDELVLKRIKNIIQLNPIDINSINLATKAVRIMSERLIEGLLEIGLDPNIPDALNLPLEVALNRKNIKIANLYWNHPLMNRFALNRNGENFAEISIKYKQWKFFETILKDEPELIFGKNKEGNLNVENILNLFNEQKYILNEEDLKIKQQKEARNQKYNVLLVPQRVREIIKELMNFCDEKNGSINMSNPEVKLLWKQAMYNKFQEKFPEQPEKKKNKASKI